MYDPTGNHPIVPYVSLCSGYEGIGLGLHRCIPFLRTVAYCEREIFGAANLCAKIEAGLLDPAPIFADVCSFPWSEFAPVMAGGILSFGWPCQPVSHAGKRKATEDERWLFDIIADGIGVMRPGWLFAENVEGLLSARMPDGSSVFGHCITRLERLHYKVAAGIFSASEVGAPHQRKRVFILAYRHGERGQLPDWWREPAEQVPVGYGEAWGDGQWPSRPGALADSHSNEPSAQRGDDGEVRSLSQTQRQSEHGAAVSGGNCFDAPAVWPSRPGEQQFAWEPPRVVADTLRKQSQRGRNAGELGSAASAEQGEAQQWKRCGNSAGNQGEAGAVVDAKSQRAGQRSELRSEECGSRSALSWDVEQSDEGALANDHSAHAGHGEQRPERTLGDLSGGCGEEGAMGNAAHTNRRPRVSAEEAGAGAENIWRRRSGESGERQTQPSLGRDADGPADWLDDAELYTTCDNRTDELRLLGNGVVPACAERAFRVLVGELMEHQP